MTESYSQSDSEVGKSTTVQREPLDTVHTTGKNEEIKILSEMICRFTPDCCLTYVNDAYARHWNRSPKEMIGVCFLDFLPESDHAFVHQHLNTFTPEESTKTLEHRIFLPDGQTRWHRWTDRALFNEEGKVVEFFSAGVDITEEHNTREQLLFQSQLLQSVRESVIVTDLSGKIIFWSHGSETKYGYSESQMIGKSISILHPEKRRNGFETTINVLEENGHWNGEEERVRADGTRLVVDVAMTFLNDTDGKPAGIISVERDISDRKRAERKILEISERERRKIGQEIHDGLCQDLKSLEFQASVLGSKLKTVSPDLYDQARNISQKLNELVTVAHSAAKGLLPVGLEQRGLQASVRDLVEKLEKQSGIPIEIDWDPLIEITKEEVNSHLFRICQESLLNAITHGKPSRIHIRFIRKLMRYELSIHDDGCGINNSESNEEGLGLHIMRYRAESIGGKLLVKKNQPRGTTIVCSFKI